MGHVFSLIKQLRKEIKTKAVMDKKLKMLESDIIEIIEKIYDVDKKINKIQKAIRRRKQKT